MTSPAKLAANRRNALKSTGPKGAEGRRQASLNAAKHGLSVPLDDFLLGPQLLPLAALLSPECSSDEEAEQLARRVLDFERNESVQRALTVTGQAMPSDLPQVVKFRRHMDQIAYA